MVELKIWRGKAYHEKGEVQLAEYLDSYHLDTGYMLIYNFNKTKNQGISHCTVKGKKLIEAMAFSQRRGRRQEINHQDFAS